MEEAKTDDPQMPIEKYDDVAKGMETVLPQLANADDPKITDENGDEVAKVLETMIPQLGNAGNPQMPTEKEDDVAKGMESVLPQSAKADDPQIPIRKEDEAAKNTKDLLHQVAKDLNNAEFDVELLEDEEDDDHYDQPNALQTKDIISAVLVILAFITSFIALCVVLTTYFSHMYRGHGTIKGRWRRSLGSDLTYASFQRNETDKIYLDHMEFDENGANVHPNFLSTCFKITKEKISIGMKKPYTDLAISVSLKSYAILGFGFGVQRGHVLRNLFVHHAPGRDEVSFYFVGYGTSNDSSMTNDENRTYAYSLMGRMVLCPLPQLHDNSKTDS